MRAMNNFIINTFENSLEGTVILETQENILQNEPIVVDDRMNQNFSILKDEDDNIYLVVKKDSTEETKSFTDNGIFIENNYVIENEDNNTKFFEKIESSQNDFEQEKKMEGSNYEINLNSLADTVEALKCKRCDFLTMDKSALLLHYKETHLIESLINMSPTVSEIEKEQILYICSKCSISLPSIKACHEHMIEDHNFKIAPLENDTRNDTDITMKESEECHKNIKQSSLKNSVNTYWSIPRTYKEVKFRLQGERTFKCTNKLCFYKFDTFDSMLTHKSCHAKITHDEKSNKKEKSLASYICTVCQKSFINWPNCSMHLWRLHSISLDLLVCPLCSVLRTHSVSKMTQHLAKHWRKNQNEDICITCKTENGNSTEDISNLPRWYAKKKCEICLKMFSNSKSLKKHIQAVHKKIKPFTCNVCGHSSSKKHTMQLHIRQHTGEKPYACDQCNYRTGDHNTLRRHRMKHTGERPYKCSYCNYSSVQSVPLKHHLKSAHPDKPIPSCLHQKLEMNETK